MKLGSRVEIIESVLRAEITDSSRTLTKEKANYIANRILDLLDRMAEEVNEKKFADYRVASIEQDQRSADHISKLKAEIERLKAELQEWEAAEVEKGGVLPTRLTNKPKQMHEAELQHIKEFEEFYERRKRGEHNEESEGEEKK